MRSHVWTKARRASKRKRTIFCHILFLPKAHKLFPAARIIRSGQLLSRDAPENFASQNFPPLFALDKSRPPRGGLQREQHVGGFSWVMLSVGWV